MRNWSTDYRADMAAVMERYRIKPDVRQALMDDDVAKLSPLVNAYLLRFYFQVRGMPQDEFMARLHAMNAPRAACGGEGRPWLSSSVFSRPATDRSSPAIGRRCRATIATN